MKYFLDTNIISYLMQKNQRIKDKLEQLIKNLNNELYISIITYYELKRGLIAANATAKLGILENIILRQFGIVMMDFSMYEKAAEIYAQLKNKGEIIEDDDIFIGATAFQFDATIITNNPRHLGRIDGLRLEVWN